MTRLLPAIAAFFLSTCPLYAQQLTGIWKGYFITKDQSQYKVEVQLKEKDGQLTGVTYSYLNTEYYGKATMTGQKDKKLGKVLMQEIKTVEVRSKEESATCLMNYTLSYSQSGKEEYLEGSYSSKYESDGKDFKKGEDCGGGIVFLRRVLRSDFDNEQSIKDLPVAKKVYYNEAPLAKKQTAASTPSASQGQRVGNKPVAVSGKSVAKTTPVAKSVTAAKSVTVAKSPAATAKPSTAKPSTAIASTKAKASTSTAPVTMARKPAAAAGKKDAENSSTSFVHKTENVTEEKTVNESMASYAEPVAVKHAPTPVANNRQNELVKEITVSTRQLNVTVYDNGEIDGDTVSVFLNGEVVLAKKRLSTTPLQLKITLDEEQEVQEITFVAENLGRIPPNTALMIVDAGEEQYRLQVLSTDKKNAVFRFRFRSSR